MKTEESTQTPITSLEALHKYLSMQLINPEAAYTLLIDAYEQDHQLKGSETTYHNLSVEFAQQDSGLFAAQTAEIGTKLYPMSTTLWADQIKYYEEIGNTLKCRNGFDKLKKVDRKYWEWRTYVFVIDYLKNARLSLPDDASYNEYFADAETIISEFKKNIPHEERSFVAKAELLILQSKFEDAIHELEDGINTVSVAPQCCMKLSDMYLERGEYEKVVTTARKGIVALLQDQPTASVGYMYYILALALDALRQKKRLSGEQFLSEQVHEILHAYQTADKLFVVEGRSAVAYRRTIESRIVILCMEEGIETPAKTEGADVETSYDAPKETVSSFV